MLKPRNSLLTVSALMAVLLSAPAFCAGPEDFEVWSRTSEASELDFTIEPPDLDAARDDWFVRIGVIGGMAPEFLGSDDFKPSWSPRLKVVWRDRLFINDRTAGVNLVRAGMLGMGGFIRYEGGRSEDNPGLDGMGDIDRTASAGVFLNMRHEGLRFKSSVRQDVLGQGQGLLAQVAVETKVPWVEPWFSLQVGTTWANAKHLGTFFGVDALQSLNAGLRRYDAGSGFRDVSVTLSSGYRLTDQWAVNGQAQYLRLLGEAADSPLVEDQGDANQYVVGMGVSYTFE